MVDSLIKFYNYYGDDYEVEYPTNSGQVMNIKQAALSVAERLVAIFQRNKEGNVPVFDSYKKMQEDPLFKDLYLFYEYFHGDSGAGLGAAHQTGWTGLVADLIEYLAKEKSK